MVKRKIDPSDIALPPGYAIEVYATGLTTPINMIFAENGEVYVADAGVATGNGKVLKKTPTGFEVIAEGFNPPLTGINFYKGNIYVSHRGFVTIVKPDGSKEDIIAGLPSWGDHHNNRVVFGPDGKMYFGQGTATNSGVVGPDNAGWVRNHPFFHDYPGQTVYLYGQNYRSENFLTAAPNDHAWTGAFSPYAVPSNPWEMVKGITRASGSVLRANPDGSNLELVAWGLRNPFRMRFDRNGRLYSTNHGMDVRGSRPVANSPDEFYEIRAGVWYGWPDYSGGYPVTLPFFKPEGEPQPQFLIANHPMRPPRPIANFVPHSAIMGWDFNYNPAFAPVGDVFMAEFGPMDPRTTGGKMLPFVGHEVSRIHMPTGQITVFARNRSGLPATADNGGGFERPIDVVFGPDQAMYIVDFGISGNDQHGDHGAMGMGSHAKKDQKHHQHSHKRQDGGHEHPFIPHTGVVWKVVRKG